MSDQEAIESAIQAFVNAYNSGNLEAMLACYSDDLIKLRQGAPAETKHQVAQRVAAVFTKFNSKVDVTIDEINVAGDLAITRGNFTVTLSPRDGGKRQSVSRRYLEVWRKENERWLVMRTMDNSFDE